MMVRVIKSQPQNLPTDKQDYRYFCDTCGEEISKENERGHFQIKVFGGTKAQPIELYSYMPEQETQEDYCHACIKKFYDDFLEVLDEAGYPDSY